MVKHCLGTHGKEKANYAEVLLPKCWGRLTLVNAVLTSQVIYPLLALKPPKEVMDLIDSKRKHFCGLAQRGWLVESAKSAGIVQQDQRSMVG